MPPAFLVEPQPGQDRQQVQDHRQDVFALRDPGTEATVTGWTAKIIAARYAAGSLRLRSLSTRQSRTGAAAWSRMLPTW